MILGGIQWATYSVAYEGMLYDELAARHHRDIYAKVLSRCSVIQTIAIALSSFGSLLMVFGYGYVTIASVAACVISCAFIARIQTHDTKTTIKKRISDKCSAPD